MGNKMNRPHKHDSKIFFPLKETVPSSVSLTIPSACTSPSFQDSEKKSKTSSADTFNWRQLQILYIQQSGLNIDSLTPSMLRVSWIVLDVLKQQLSEICCDLYFGILKMPEVLQEHFGLKIKAKRANQSSVISTDMMDTTKLTKKMILHFVKVLYFHDLVLKHFKLGAIDEGIDLIKQMAVHHALVGVTPTDFWMMDWFLIHYLVESKLVTDDSINVFMTYLNTFSNYVAKFYESQGVRRHMLDQLTKDKVDDRNNKARENFRILKKWRKHTESFRTYEGYVEDLIEEQTKLRKKEEDAESIDTVILKANDCLMRCCMSRKKFERELNQAMEKRQRSIDSSFL